MNVLSLFDGMSCGQLALTQLGIKIDKYYASEIDKYAIQITQKNFPDTIQLGNVTKLDLSTLPKIDLVMGGSPCQGFSFAGNQLAFDDPRSALFFEFHKAISYLQPKYFLLENVKMKKEYLYIISEYMGVGPIFINSSLVSAQSRQRYYWTNVPNVEQPEERGIVIRDILETTVDAKLENNKSHKPQHIGTAVDIKGHDQIKRVYSPDGKSPTVTTCGGGHREPKVVVNNVTSSTNNDHKIILTRDPNQEVYWRKLTPLECERLQTVPDNYTEGVSNTQRYKMLGNGWTIEVIKHILKNIIN